MLSTASVLLGSAVISLVEVCPGEGPRYGDYVKPREDVVAAKPVAPAPVLHQSDDMIDDLSEEEID